MSLIVQAWNGMSDRPFTYRTLLKYSRQFKDYNGNIMLKGDMVTVKLSHSWKTVSVDIQIGIIQHLLGRLFKKKVTTTNIDLYNSFLKHVHKTIPKKDADPVLLASFDRINDRFFANVMERPNLEWSTGSSKLGWYHYGSDTVAISELLAADLDLLDYVMYHELLHKHHKFKNSGSRMTYHSKAFREDEAKFPNAALLEKRLQRLGWLQKVC